MFFQAEDGIRDLVRSRGLRDVYKSQYTNLEGYPPFAMGLGDLVGSRLIVEGYAPSTSVDCPLYTTDAADDPHCVDIRRRRSIAKNTISPLYRSIRPRL